MRSTKYELVFNENTAGRPYPYTLRNLDQENWLLYFHYQTDTDFIFAGSLPPQRKGFYAYDSRCPERFLLMMRLPGDYHDIQEIRYSGSHAIKSAKNFIKEMEI